MLKIKYQSAFKVVQDNRAFAHIYLVPFLHSTATLTYE